MQAIMPFASPECKPKECLSHHFLHYPPVMAGNDASDRLKRAREKAGFATAKEAAEAMGVPVASYIQHENGTRGFKQDRAVQYARRFRTTPEWLLLGKGKAPGADPVPSEDQLAEMMRIAIEGVTLETRLVDFPRIVAPVLREELRHFLERLADHDRPGSQTAHDTDAQPRRPTN